MDVVFIAWMCNTDQASIIPLMYAAPGSSTMYEKRRRNDLDIVADILCVARDRGGALKTQIVYGANLNFRIVKGYLARLIGSKMLLHDHPRYYATEKGRDYLVAYEALSAF